MCSDTYANAEKHTHSVLLSFFSPLSACCSMCELSVTTPSLVLMLHKLVCTALLHLCVFYQEELLLLSLLCALECVKPPLPSSSPFICFLPRLMWFKACLKTEKWAAVCLLLMRAVTLTVFTLQTEREKRTAIWEEWEEEEKEWHFSWIQGATIVMTLLKHNVVKYKILTLQLLRYFLSPSSFLPISSVFTPPPPAPLSICTLCRCQ